MSSPLQPSFAALNIPQDALRAKKVFKCLFAWAMYFFYYPAALFGNSITDKITRHCFIRNLGQMMGLHPCNIIIPAGCADEILSHNNKAERRFRFNHSL